MEVTAPTAATSEPKIQTPVDHFIEEYGHWSLEMVRFGADDGGQTLDVYVSKDGAELRDVCPNLYMGQRTVILQVDVGWGASPS